MWNATDVFRDRLGELGWGAMALGISCHILRLLAVSRAWRNIIKGAYPRAVVRWRSIVAAVFAGVGVNAIIPVRGGDAVRVVLAKRSIEGSSYATIASTLVLLSLFDFVVATCIVSWAAVSGRLPKVLGPSFDFSWAFHNPGTFLKVIAVVLVVLLVILLWFAEQIGDFRRRLTQGFAILRDRRAYLRLVAVWQGIDWMLRFVAVLFFLSAFGLPVTVENALLVQVSAGLASLLPISPSGIGTEQAFLLYLLRDQASRTALLAFSVGMRITLIAVNVALGFTALFVTLRTMNWREHMPARTSEPDTR
ncbi:MAG TPA: lysylphosphatidylglycerol synthase transmembrane domain-containing protein [Gaiellaceae bacterium]